MPTRNVNLTDELDRFVLKKVKTGRYENASEVVRAALRTLEREELEYESNVAGRGALERNIVARQQNATRGRQLQPRDHAQCGRFAAAGRTEQAEELAILDGKVRVLDRDEVAERLVQSLNPDLRHEPAP